MKKQVMAILGTIGYLALFMGCQAITVIMGVEDEILSSFISNLLFILIIFVIFYIKRVNAKERLNINKISVKDVLIVIAISLVVNLLFQTVQLLFPEGMREQLIEEANIRIGENILFSFGAVVLLAPVAEEILFRGLIFGLLKRNMNLYLAGILQAVMFGIMHGNIIWGIIATLIALFYAFLMERYKSIFAPLTGHIAVNLLAFILN